MGANDRPRDRPDADTPAALETAGNAVIVLDEHGTIKSLNHAAQRMFGYAADDVVGSDISLLITGGIAVLGRATSKVGGGGSVAVTGRRRDGSTLPTNLTLTEWRCDGGRCFVAAMRDGGDAAGDSSQLGRDPDRFELLMQGVRNYALCLLDPNGDVVTWNCGAERITGWPAREIVGMPFAVLLVPAASMLDAGDALLDAARLDSHQTERAIGRQDGTTLVAHMTLSPLRADGGELRGFAVVLRDVTEQRRVTRERQRLAAIIDASPEFVAVTDPAGALLFLNPTAQRLLGRLSRDPAEPGAIARLWPQEFRRMLMAEAMPSARRDGFWSGEGSIAVGGGARVPILLTVVAHDDGAGTVSHFSILGRDITERKRAEEHQRRLMREVDHRAKNALAVVQSILRLSRARDTRSFVHAVEGRIAALARVHTLVATNRWESADIRAIIDGELEAMDSAVHQRVLLQGGALEITPGAAQAVALTLHELATNACRHGALKTPAGRVVIAWRMTEGELQFEWIESGRARRVSSASRGFGFDIIRAMVEDQLDGRIALDWLTGGLRCHMHIPARRVLPADEP